MKVKIIFSILLLAVCSAGFPLKAQTSDYGLIFDSVTGKFYLDVSGNHDPSDPNNVPYTSQSGNWSWDAATRTLSLNNFSWTTTANYALYIPVGIPPTATTIDDLIFSIAVNISGVNTFSSESSQAANGVYYGILSDVALTIAGDGQLNANAVAGNSNNSWAQGLTIWNTSLTVLGGTVNATANNGYGSKGIWVSYSNSDTVTVSGGTVNATANSESPEGLFVTGSLTVSGGAVNAAANSSGDISPVGLFCFNYTQTGGSVTVRGESNDPLNVFALYIGNTHPGDIEKISGGTLNVTANGGQFDEAIYTENATPITFAGGTVTVAASGSLYGFVGVDFIIIAPSYTYWTDWASGSGTSVPPGKEYNSNEYDSRMRTSAYVRLTTLSLTLSATGGAYTDNSVALTAAISNWETGAVPTGRVTFKEGDTTLGTAEFDGSGAAMLALPPMIDAGSHTYTAEYSGDDNYPYCTANCKLNVNTFLSVSPAAQNFIAAGETKPFTVACNDAGAHWTLSNSAPWLTILSGDDGEMLMKAAANSTADQRYALVSIGIPGVMSQSIQVTQDGASETSIEAVGAPAVNVYSQNGDVIVKSDVPVQSVAVYDVSGKLVKQVKGGNDLITISGLSKQQALIVRVTTSLGTMNYELRIN